MLSYSNRDKIFVSFGSEFNTNLSGYNSSFGYGRIQTNLNLYSEGFNLNFNPELTFIGASFFITKTENKIHLHPGIGWSIYNRGLPPKSIFKLNLDFGLSDYTYITTNLNYINPDDIMFFMFGFKLFLDFRK